MLYVGSHFGYPTDGYICSSARMKNAYRRRPSDFMRRIVYWLKKGDDRQDLLDKEYEWLKKIPTAELGKRFYNLHNGKPGHWVVDKKEKIGQKLSSAIKEKWNDEDYRSSVRKGFVEKWSRPEYRRKRAVNHSRAMKESWADPEKRAMRMKAARTSKRFSESVCKKQGESLKAFWADPENRQKMMEARSGQKETATKE